ncbi:MAG: glycosyltransferase family 1 protein [Bdellovibrionota bacterium]
MNRTIGFDISALDTSFKEHSARGIGRYVSELKNYFDSANTNGTAVKYFDHTLFSKNSIIDRLIDSSPIGRDTLKQQIIYPLRLKSRVTSEYSGLHFPAHMDAPSWSRKPYILTVLDIIPLVLKDLYSADNPGWKFKLARFLELRAIKSASVILAISQCTADDLNRVLNIPYEKIVVTPLGVDTKFFDEVSPEKRKDLRLRYKIPENDQYVLYVGGIDPRKNYKLMLESFSNLLKMCSGNSLPQPSLVLAGRIETDREYPKLLEIIAKLGLKDRVILTGFVPDEELRIMLKEAEVFFFPSLYEGFGLPPLEAMAAGTPVVSSDKSSMPEVLGKAALYFDPSNSQQAAERLFEVISNSNKARSMSEAGIAQAKNFSWSKTGDLTLKAYEFFLNGQ